MAGVIVQRNSRSSKKLNRLVGLTESDIIRAKLTTGERRRGKCAVPYRRCTRVSNAPEKMICRTRTSRGCAKRDGGETGWTRSISTIRDSVWLLVNRELNETLKRTHRPPDDPIRDDAVPHHFTV